MGTIQSRTSGRSGFKPSTVEIEAQEDRYRCRDTDNEATLRQLIVDQWNSERKAILANERRRMEVPVEIHTASVA
jgi:hypothetical protein